MQISLEIITSFCVPVFLSMYLSRQPHLGAGDDIWSILANLDCRGEFPLYRVFRLLQRATLPKGGTTSILAGKLCLNFLLYKSAVAY